MRGKYWFAQHYSTPAVHWLEIKTLWGKIHGKRGAYNLPIPVTTTISTNRQQKKGIKSLWGFCGVFFLCVPSKKQHKSNIFSEQKDVFSNLRLKTKYACH